jgi:hypothetical protein
MRTLFIKGGRDDRSHADALEARLRRQLTGGMPPQLMVYPEADHAILRWPLGENTPPPTWPSGYPEVVAIWILTFAG